MRLKRTAHNQIERSVEVYRDHDATKITKSDDGRDLIVIEVPRFKWDDKHSSDLQIEFGWEDVQMVIDLYASAGNAEAVALRQAWQLMEAAKDLGWTPPVHGEQ